MEARTCSNGTRYIMQNSELNACIVFLVMEKMLLLAFTLTTGDTHLVDVQSIYQPSTNCQLMETIGLVEVKSPKKRQLVRMQQLPIQQNHQDAYEPMELDLAESDDRDEMPVLDEVNLDLESYICFYSGLPRINRLEFIADHCKSLRVEALSSAINYIKEHTYNVKDYLRLFRKLQEARDERSAGVSGQSNSGPTPQLDTMWIDLKRKQAALRLERLESDLKNFRSNSMKENIRRGQDDLGDHFLDCGEIENAFNVYSKSQDYAQTHRNQINQCLNMIRVGILLKRWSVVSNHVLRAQSQPINDNSHNSGVTSKLACAAGLFELNSRKYKKAAKYFLAANFDHFSQPNSLSTGSCTTGAPSSVASGSSGGSGANVSTSSSSFVGSFATSGNHHHHHHDKDIHSCSAYTEILAPINIAVYGSLCALATFSRQELANQLINSVSFKQFSELEPQLREAVSKFHESKYAQCLAILNEIKNVLLLDMYLAPHVDRLYRAIRSKALVQYFEPYSTANMYRMAEAFNTSVSELEQEVISLIHDGHIKARIDSFSKILFAKSADSRTLTFERAIKMGKQWQRQTQALISRMAIMNAGLVVNSCTAPDRATIS